MSDILHDFRINAPPDRVFRAVSDPAELDQWWTHRSSGRPESGAEYELDFGPQYNWRAIVTQTQAGREFELELTQAGADWTGTRVGFTFEPVGPDTAVRFHHTGWRAANDHYRTSCFCWAMYLRLLRRLVENGETVPYDLRLDV